MKSLIADICVSMKAEDYLTLPEYIEDVVPVQLDAKARKAYDTMERDMLLQVDPETVVTAGTAAVLNGKLLQLCSGAMYDEEKHVVPIHGCKIEAFMEVVEQLHGEHALVFYWFQHEQERLRILRDDLRNFLFPGHNDFFRYPRLDQRLLHG